LCKPLFDRLLPQVTKALAEAKIEKSAIAEVVMVGGSTYIPKVREILKDYFEKSLNHLVSPEIAVCAGASIQAALLTNNTDSLIENFFLLDVVPLSLGVENFTGDMHIVIKKNTSIPIQK
jgi:L1 cell adhesion molecule like protein